jgi:hypothetical protein
MVRALLLQPQLMTLILLLNLPATLMQMLVERSMLKVTPSMTSPSYGACFIFEVILSPGSCVWIGKDRVVSEKCCTWKLLVFRA